MGILKFLFLPAPDGKYVSVWTRTAEAVKASVGMRAAKVTGSVDSGVYLQALARQSGILVRLASRSELFGCSFDGVGLLFLPAATHYWCSLSHYARVTEAISLYFYSASVAYWGRVVERQSRFGIRLASRSEFSGCSVDGVGLLFLPADTGSLWTISTTNNYGDGALGAIRGRISDPLLADARQKPCNRFGIRLASRSELSIVLMVFGLLFLPARDGKYVSVWTRTAEAVNASEGMRAAKVTVSGAGGVFLQALARQTRLLVRLASRSELFGCSVDGVGVSVPARCGLVEWPEVDSRASCI